MSKRVFVVLQYFFVFCNRIGSVWCWVVDHPVAKTTVTVCVLVLLEFLLQFSRIL